MSKGKHDCATCGWGVSWFTSDYDGKMHGYCQFKPSIPVPEHYGFACCFGEDTPMPEKCPAWKKPNDVNYVPKWKEEYYCYMSRINALFSKKSEEIFKRFETLKAEIIAEDPEMAARLRFI